MDIYICKFLCLGWDRVKRGICWSHEPEMRVRVLLPSMYIIIIVMPLVSFIVNSTIGRKIGKQGSKIITNILIIISAILTYIGAYEIIISGSEVSIEIKRWVMRVEWSMKYDKITIMMCIIVLTISTSVMIYTSAYMESDPFIQRFNGYLSIFIFNMLVVITSKNYLVMFMGWEGSICLKW